MANCRVKFNRAEFSQKEHKPVTTVGQIIDVQASGSKPTHQEVVKALEKLLGVNNLGPYVGHDLSTTSWEVV